MKKTLVAIVALLLAFSAFAPGAHAMDVGIGLTSYYSWWTPPFEETLGNDPIDPMFMIGPAVSLRFFKSLTIGIYGIFSYNSPEVNCNYTTQDSNKYQVQDKRTIDKYDTGITASYALNRYFSLFCGIKLSFYEMTMENGKIANSGGGFDDYNADNAETLENDVFGYALGMTINIPLTDTTTASLGISALYQPGEYYGFDKRTSTTTIDERDVEYSAWGVNATLSIAYYMSEISTSLIIGGRFQYLKYHAEEEDIFKMDREIHYGITFAAMYHFSLFED